MQAVLLGGLLGKSEAVGAANPYGCNGEQHQTGCPRGLEGEDNSTNEIYEVGNSYKTPRNTPLLLDEAQESIHRDKWASQIGDGLNINTPLGNCTLSATIDEKDWSKYDSNERAWRKSNLNFAITTLKNPQEVWQGHKGNKIYISKFEGSPSRVVIAVTNGNNVITYYAEKNYPDMMNKYRKGKLLYARKKA